VGLRDQLSMYQMMWHRGTERARDIYKAYYEEVRHRVERGIAYYPGEKYRIMWSTSLGTPAAWARWAEEKYDAVCVASHYGVIARDAYPRAMLNGDPLRTLAGRHMLLFWNTPEWTLHAAQQNRCHGIVMCPPRAASYTAKFREAGMPLAALPHGDQDNDGVRAILSRWFEQEIVH
jgi:hypothetical protein